MPVSTLVTTAGAANANAYCDVAFADQYHLDRPPVGTTWSGASFDQKSAAILWATKLIDDLYEWRGWTTDAVQILQWPRQGLIKRTGWEQLDIHSIPLEIQQATAEYARQLLAGDLAGNSDIETQGITRLKAGPVEIGFKDTVVAKPVPDTVAILIPIAWGFVRNRNAVTRNLLRA